MRCMLTAVLVGVATIAGAQSSPQAPVVQEKADVNLVLVDATVMDHSGHQMLGLGKDDFIVKDNGVQQEVASLDYFTNRRLIDSPEALAKFNVERVREERYFILFFDKSVDANNLQGALLRAAAAGKHLVDHDLQPKDRLAVVGFDSRIKIYCDFTSDHAVMKRALDQAVLFSQGIKPSSADSPDSILANIDWKTADVHTSDVYQAVKTLAEGTKGIHARKSLIVFSGGIWDTLQVTPGEDPEYQPMLRALNTQNITVDTLNLPPGEAADADTLERVALDTGGQYFRLAVNYERPLQVIENKNNGYYLIGFYAKKGTEAGSYHRLDVSLKNPEFLVSARRGYIE